MAIPPSLRDVINAAGGLQHVQFSGGIQVGSFYLWIGDAGYEEAEFLFELSWEFKESGEDLSRPIFELPAMCERLGVERIRTFRIPVVSLDQYGFKQLWKLLKMPSDVEELELCADAARGLCSAQLEGEGHLWATLPGLRSVRMVKGDVAEMTEKELLGVLRGNAKH